MTLMHSCSECTIRKLSYGAPCGCGSWLCNEHMGKHVSYGHEPPRYWKRDALGEDE